MDFLTNLWLPILASAAAVWVASAVIWMALPHHAKDYKKLPNEAAFLDFVRSQNIPPGAYGYPEFGCHSDNKQPERAEVWKKGPMGHITVWPTPPQMGSKMFFSFCVNLAVSIVIGYIAWETLAPGSPTFMRVFQIAGASGILAYCFSFMPNMIWFGGGSSRPIAMCFIDGVACGLITGAIFGALWPGV